MKVTIEVNDDDVMALLMAGKSDDPILLPYGKAIADEVAHRLSLDTIELEEMRAAYIIAGDAMNNLGSMVKGALTDFNERQNGDEPPSEVAEEVDSDQ